MTITNLVFGPAAEIDYQCFRIACVFCLSKKMFSLEAARKKIKPLILKK